MNAYPRPLRHIAAFVAIGCSSVCGQVASQSANAVRDSSVVTLSPFEVTTTKDVGYESLNANSISGLNTSLLNVPVTAEIYNQQFFDDLGLSNSAALLLEWATGQSANGKPQNGIITPGEGIGDTPFMIRGIPSGAPRMDGFLSAAENFLDNTSQERTEVIRGPQSLLYGTAGASGVINYQSKTAIFGRNQARLQLRLDEWGTFRTQLDANYAVSSQLALRAAYTRGKEEYYVERNEKKLDAWYAAAAYRPFQRVTIRAHAGISHVFKYRPADSNANVPGDPRSGRNLNLLLAQGNVAGLYFKPIDWSNVDAVAGNASIAAYILPNYGGTTDLQLASWLNLRVMGGATRYNTSKEDSFTIANSQGVLSPAATNNPTGKWATGGRPSFGQFGSRQKGIRALLDAKFDLLRGRIKNSLTVGAESTKAELLGSNPVNFYLVDANGQFAVNRANIANNDAGRTLIPITYWSLEDGSGFGGWNVQAKQIVLNGNTYRAGESSILGQVPPTPTNPGGFNGTRVGGPTHQLTWAKGYYATLNSELFNNRVSLLGGVRRNFQEQWNQDESRLAVWATTWSAGAVYHLNPYVSPYYNYSLSYAPNGAPGGARPQNGGEYPSVNNGVGNEAGLKFNVPRFRLTGSLAAYTVDVKDSAVVLFNDSETIDPTSAINGNHQGRLAYFSDYSVKGAELSATANPTRNWRVRFSVSYNTDVVGKRVALERWYNDEFRVNAAGQVTFANNAPALVPSVASNPASPLIPLTVAMMKDPASGYLATLDTGSGRIRDLGGRSFAALGLVGRPDGQTIGTDRTGLPITSHQLGWIPPTPDFVVISGGDHLAIPRLTESATVTRTFSEGRLKGFSTGLTVAARQHQLAYYYVDVADGNKRKAKFIPDQVNTNLMLSYRFRFAGRYQWTSQVNITNLLNHRDLVFIRNAGSGVVENAKMNTVPRSWAWTNTLEF
ncbi:MAG: TonB-dependent receptor [Opitutaceae bacterium]|nr:TonB-dependent receptor [Opitutaceae bacterium]